MIWTLLVGCIETELDTGETQVIEDRVFAYVITADQLSFGDQPVDERVERELRIQNTGNLPVLFIDMEYTQGMGLEAGPAPGPIIQPGNTMAIPVTWVPTATGDLIGEITLKLAENPTLPETILVPATLSSKGPELSLSTESYDFGEIPVGCSSEFSLTLSNTGNTELIVDTVSLVGGSSYLMEQPPDPLPWAIAPFSSKEVTVHYSPQANSTETSSLSFDSNDGQHVSNISGFGQVDGANTLTWIVGERSRSTFVFHANECVIDGNYGTYSQQLEDSLPTFYQALLDNASPFRVAFIWNRDGMGTGNVAYIDETYTAAQATAETLEMITEGANAGDNDGSYDTLLAALRENGDWLFEDDDWKDSKLNLVALNRDQEQSTTAGTVGVSTAQGYKDDPDNVIFHAIAGPPPSGCGSAESFAGFKTAVDATGGTFSSICEPNWDSSMEKLVAGSVAGAEYFALNGTVLTSSITVKVDQVKITSGWSFSSSLNAVVFDQDIYPSKGSEVEIYYLKSDACG